MLKSRQTEWYYLRLIQISKRVERSIFTLGVWALFQHRNIFGALLFFYAFDADFLAPVENSINFIYKAIGVRQ